MPVDKHKNEVRLYYTWRANDKDGSVISDQNRERLLTQLSPDKRQAIQRLVHVGDQDSSLLGLLLLKRCAADFNLTSFELADVDFPEKGKPKWLKSSPANCVAGALPVDLDFNISHSSNIIVLAASCSMKVGVDIEKKRRLKPLSYRSVMHANELTMIQQEPNLFFRLWTIKEAVVKAADTVGLSRVLDVDIRGFNSEPELPLTAFLDNKNWLLKELSIDEKFCLSLATSAGIDKLVMQEMGLNELF